VSLRVDGGDPGGAVQHVGPFGSLVPMQLANAAGTAGIRRLDPSGHGAAAPTLRHAPSLPGHTLTASSTTARLVRSG
jgi:hypothetical protein